MNPFQRRRGSKYGSRKTITADGITFDSRLEARRWKQLKLLQAAGMISQLDRQVKVKLTQANIGYIPDFVYTENGRRVHEDVKGLELPEFCIKKRLWKVYGPGPLRILKSVKGAIKTVEEVIPEPALFDG
jgi:hypothetical protein